MPQNYMVNALSVFCPFQSPKLIWSDLFGREREEKELKMKMELCWLYARLIESLFRSCTSVWGKTDEMYLQKVHRPRFVRTHQTMKFVRQSSIILLLNYEVRRLQLWESQPSYRHQGTSYCLLMLLRTVTKDNVSIIIDLLFEETTEIRTPMYVYTFLCNYDYTYRL